MDLLEVRIFKNLLGHFPLHLVEHLDVFFEFRNKLAVFCHFVVYSVLVDFQAKEICF